MNTPTTTRGRHKLPELAYGYDALEPHVDARTMVLHHDEHHGSYVKKLNEALESVPQLHGRDAFWLLLNPGAVPRAIRATVRNNAGGHLNHSLFWQAMSPLARGLEPGRLAEAIDRDFGSVDRFKARFEQAGTALFGSGWVWLARARRDGGRLKIYTTRGHENPLTQGHYPILLNDVWEHAYYLKHESRRDEYLRGWWQVVDWHEAARRFEQSDSTAEQVWEDEGGQTRPPTPASQPTQRIE